MNGGGSMSYPDYLQHYGALGMKKRHTKKISDKELSNYRKSLMANAPRKSGRYDSRATKGYYRNMPKASLTRHYRDANVKFEQNARRLRNGSSYAVVGMAFSYNNLPKLANYFYNKSNKKYDRWRENAKTYLSEIKGYKVSDLDVWSELDRRGIK